MASGQAWLYGYLLRLALKGLMRPVLVASADSLAVMAKLSEGCCAVRGCHLGYRLCPLFIRYARVLKVVLST